MLVPLLLLLLPLLLPLLPLHVTSVAVLCRVVLGRHDQTTPLARSPVHRLYNVNELLHSTARHSTNQHAVLCLYNTEEEICILQQPGSYAAVEPQTTS
jgi:hypothetical protein